MHLIVAIGYGRGVICADPKEGISGEYFARFIRRNFPILFEITGKNKEEPKLFVMDNDPSQTSAKAKCHAKCKMVQISARSPDLNPIGESLLTSLFTFLLISIRLEAVAVYMS